MSDNNPATRAPDGAPPTPVARRISNPRPKKSTDKPKAPLLTKEDAALSDTTGDAPMPSAEDVHSKGMLGTPNVPPAMTGEWPEPEAPNPATPGIPEAKRKRRRRKGKGQGGTSAPPNTVSLDNPATAMEVMAAGRRSANSAELMPAPQVDLASRPDPFVRKPGAKLTELSAPPAEEIQVIHESGEPAIADLPKPAPRIPQQAPRPHVLRPKIDPEILALKAWKIFLAEVSEEGVALISDQDARELARRCFRLAEIFTEEQARRLAGD